LFQLISLTEHHVGCEHERDMNYAVQYEHCNVVTAQSASRLTRTIDFTFEQKSCLNSLSLLHSPRPCLTGICRTGIFSVWIFDGL